MPIYIYLCQQLGRCYGQGWEGWRVVIYLLIALPQPQFCSIKHAYE